MKYHSSILDTGFIMGICLSTIGAWLKITHREGTEIFLILGVIASLLYILSAIYEVARSTYIPRSEKIMWISGFILTSGIAGFVYLLSGRKRVLGRTRHYRNLQ